MVLTECSHHHKRKQDPLFAQFRNCDAYYAAFRVAAVSDSTVDGISVKALTKAFFDSARYSPTTVYIFTHPAGDTLTVTTSDQPLLSWWDFSQFYRAHSDRGYADTIVSPRFFDRFIIEPQGIVDFERFDLLPFLFLDVTFDGKPELLIRRLLNSNYFYRFQAYEITDQGFRVLDDEPFTSLKNRNSEWVFGGASKIDYDNKTISTSAITPGSCSDYGATVSTPTPSTPPAAN